MLINLNADLGESYGAFTIGDDAALIGLVTSANIACGLHGGDPRVMRNTVLSARANGVSIGAHPGFADLYGFGRRPMILPDDELEALVLYQIGAIAAVARVLDWPITHVKPHGALNNQACKDRHMADVVACTIRAFDPDLILLAPALSELAAAGAAAGLPVAIEVFADRTYESDGQLTPRSVSGSVLHDTGQVVNHVLQMVARGGITSRDGSFLPASFHSVCLHGDGATAVATAAALRAALLADGHSLVPLTAFPAAILQGPTF